MIEKRAIHKIQPKCGKLYLRYFFCMLVVFYVMHCPLDVNAKETLKIEFFYENVCAPCDGTEEFYNIYDRCITPEEKEHIEVASYNVFMDANKEYYEQVAAELEIPESVSLPILVVKDQWMSGYEQMEESLPEVLAGQKKAKENTNRADDKKEQALHLDTLVQEVEKSDKPLVLFFTTDSCKDCEQVKQWLEERNGLPSGTVKEFNIIQDNSLDVLKSLFRAYRIPEKEQKVPAFFYGEQAVTGKEQITSLDSKEIEKKADNRRLADRIKGAEKGADKTEKGEQINLFTLAGAGLLAGLNPCSISMLLMLLSLLISEKASVWKHGLFYLAGKYITYFGIGIIIYTTASQMDGRTLERAGEVINLVLVFLFAAAGVLYSVDAVRIYRKDYGKIRTQLPVGLRKWNHNLIRSAFRHSGALQPLLILGLGIAISLGEFFCTGQVYMATITYMLKEQTQGAWLPFLIYVTAMSLPAVGMIVLIQRTRNTEHVSEFMLRHLGVIKIFNAVLFFGFMIYFLLQ